MEIIVLKYIEAHYSILNNANFFNDKAQWYQTLINFLFLIFSKTFSSSGNG